MQELIEKVAEWLYGFPNSWDYTDDDTRDLMRQQAKELLSLSTDTHRFAVVEKEPELPDNPHRKVSMDGAIYLHNAYELAQKDMINAGWVQEVRE